MSNDDEAITRIMESIIVAWADLRDDQSLSLYKELVENCQIAYGDEAGSQLVSHIYALPIESQFAFLDMKNRLKGTKFDLNQ